MRIEQRRLTSHQVCVELKKKQYQITVHDHAVLNKQYPYFGASIYDTVCSMNRKQHSSHRNINHHTYRTGSLGSM